MNRKGFAITSVIYGLAILGMMVIVILMGTLSSTRNNVSEEAKNVEEFLIAFSQTHVTYRGKGNYVYKVPNGESGWYRIEAFGPRNAAGGSFNGAYVTGIVYLNEEDSLIFQIGDYGSSTKVFVRNGGYDIHLLEAAGGKNGYPGGTVKCYSSAPLGGDINVDSYSLNSGTYVGNQSITFNYTEVCGNTSFIRGYPTSFWVYDGFATYSVVDGLMLAGANAGNEGKVIVERLAERSEEIPDIPRKNKRFDNVSSVVVNGSKADISYSYHDSFDGNNFKGYVKTCTATTNCNVGGKNIDDLTIYVDGYDAKDLKDVTVTLKHSDGTDDYVVYRSSVSGNVSLGYGVSMKPTGLHFSAYQPDHTTSDILSSSNNFAMHGNYYIIPVVSENMVVSAASSAADDGNPLKIEYMTGESRQKWSIDMINSPISGATSDFPNISNMSGRKEYRIVELTRYKALNIYYDENYKMNYVSASETFNSLSRNEPQIWNIYPLNDGTYAIKTVVKSFSSGEKSGFLFAKPRGGTNNINDVLIGLAVDPQPWYDKDDFILPTNIERFYLYSLDFSS